MMITINACNLVIVISVVVLTLRQIENEYGNIDSAYGAAAQRYIHWSASMALSLDTGVPWVMCQQSDAPDPIVCLSLPL
jgi:Glycosyl hydrolases family 35